jgi:hypothetical protein
MHTDAPDATAGSCGSCGAANKSSAKFCRQCGAPLGAAIAAAAADTCVNEPHGPAAPADDGSLTDGHAFPTADAAPAVPTARPDRNPPVIRGLRLSPGLGIAFVAIALAGVLLFVRSRNTPEAQQVAAPRAAPSVAERGSLRVDVNVPARATLDGWHLPDGGAQAASAVVFSDVEASTHTLEVWSAGYRRESLSVVIKPKQTSRLSVTLQRVD